MMDQFNSLRILYVGDLGLDTTSQHRMAALMRLGHQVTAISQSEVVPSQGRVVGKINYVTGYRLVQSSISAKFKSLCANGRWDVAWVDAGWWCGPKIAQILKSVSQVLCLVNLDDPTGPREPHFWRSLLAAVPHFDLCVTVREETATELQYLGAKGTLIIPRGYDEVGHNPCRADAIPSDRFCSRVSFIGTWMEDRGEFLVSLIDRGVPLSIWGNGWQASRVWRYLASSWRGGALIGADYVAAIKRADLCLGLLSRFNRDQRTNRSAEIPYVGGVLCARRTKEHLAMYKEGVEAVFWDDVNECADQCLELLANPAKRNEIQVAGAAAVRAQGIGNEAVCSHILSELMRK